MLKFLLYMLQSSVNVHIDLFLPKKMQQNLTEKKFEATVENAFNDVQYYKSKYKKAGIKLSDIKSIKDIKKLPFLTKDEIRLFFPDDIVSNKFDISKCHYSATTGSTGKSLPFIFSLKTFAFYLTTSLRVYTMIGYRPWQKIAYIKYTKVKTLNLGPFFQTIHIPSTIKYEKQIEILIKSESDILTGYASIILEIANKIKKKDLEKINLKSISVNSEMSTKSQREFISSVFNCPVYDEYSTEETWMIASQCRYKKYHIFTDNVWVEFLDKNGNDVKPGETGEIVLTSLASPAMPFIRYKIGDLGVPGTNSCKCGCSFPILQSFEGRADDSFKLKDGSYISSLKLLNTFTMYIKRYLHLMDEFKVIQIEPNLIEIKLVKGKEFSEKKINELLKSLSNILGDSVNINMNYVEQISFNGIKRKAIESYV